MFDIHQSIYDRNDEIEEKRVEQYIDGLMREFVTSAEAQSVFDQYGDSGWPALMMEYAINYIGVTPAEMSLPDFEEVVFDLFPRKVSTEPDSAPAIVAELRAFWSFLHRQYGLANAPKILAVLTNAAVKRLERELANPAHWGMAKSLFMLGKQAGFDMTTQEGLNAFMAYYNGGLAGGGPREVEGLPLLPPIWEEPPSTLSPKQRADKRKKHKAQRQARKRNRK